MQCFCLDRWCWRVVFLWSRSEFISICLSFKHFDFVVMPWHHAIVSCYCATLRRQAMASCYDMTLWYHAMTSFYDIMLWHHVGPDDVTLLWCGCQWGYVDAGDGWCWVELCRKHFGEFKLKKVHLQLLKYIYFSFFSFSTVNLYSPINQIGVDKSSFDSKLPLLNSDFN